MRTCLSSQLRSLSGKQGTTSLGKSTELPRPQRGSPQQWGKNKIVDMMTKRIGQLTGALVGIELEAMGGWSVLCQNAQYLEIRSGNFRIGLDFSKGGLDAHGLPHIDVYNGYVQKANKMFGGSRFALFLEGFQAGLF